jgi:nucleotide-binding universal stress UspA family protein
MDFEYAFGTKEQEQPRPQSEARPLGNLAAVVAGEDGSALVGHAIDRAALLPLAPGARVRPVRLVERTDARGRRGLSLEPTGSSPGDGRPDAELAPELVVIARGPRTAAAWLFGSLAERFARSAEQPVLVVRRPATRPYARVLVATDLSEASADGVRFSARVAARGAEAWLLHVYDTSYELVLRVTNAAPERIIAQRAEARERAEAGMAELATRTASAGWSPRPVCVSGDPGSEIRRFVRAEAVELLVIGKHVLSHPGRPMLGSVAVGCLRAAPCDVLVVPGPRPTMH